MDERPPNSSQMVIICCVVALTVANGVFMLAQQRTQEKLTALVHKRLPPPAVLAAPGSPLPPAFNCPKVEVNVNQPLSSRLTSLMEEEWLLRGRHGSDKHANFAPRPEQHGQPEGKQRGGDGSGRRPARSVALSAAAAVPASALPATPTAPASSPLSPPANSDAPRIVTPADQTTLWTLKSLRANDLSMLVTLAPPPSLKQHEAWAPELLATSDGAAAPVRVTGHKTSRPLHTLRLELTPLVRAKDPTMELKLSAEMVGSQRPGPPSSLHLASLRDLGGSGPMVLYLTPGGQLASGAPKNWTPLAPQAATAEAPLILQLWHSYLLPNLAPLLLNAKSLNLTLGRTAIKATSTCFLKARALTACASGRALNNELTTWLAAQINADVAFRGSPEQFLGQPTSADELLSIMKSASHQLFVYEERKNYQPYAVPAHFVGRTKGAPGYLADGATLLFSEVVELWPVHASAH